jgi:hypothetical protein
MDSELTSINDVKALNQSVTSGASPTFNTTNFTDATNKRFMTDAQETVLNNTSGTNSGDSQTLAAGVSDVTATATELNLLDLSGLTAGWVLSADTATTASWKAATGGTGSSITIANTAPGSPTEGDVWVDDATMTMYVWYDDGTSTQWVSPVTVTSGDTELWASLVDNDIIPETDSTYDLGSTGTRFAETYTDALDVTNNVTIGGNIIITGTVDGRNVATDGSKLDGIEDNATADQTAAQIKTAYESNAETNALTDAEKTLLGTLETGATADQTDAEIRTAVASATDSNVFTDSHKTKVDYISVTQAVNLDQMETDIAALANGMVYKGDWAANAGTFPGSGSAQTGWFYYVSVAGTVNSVTFNVGDNIVATTNNASTSTYASNWSKHDQTDAVQSVNSQTGSIVLDADNIAETGTRYWASEAGATADQTDAEIRAAVEAATDSNVFTDNDHTKLNGIATGANLYTHPNHSGDVTSVNDGATTIASNAVTFAKMQDIGTDTFIGRDTAGTGDPEQLSVATVLTMLNVESGAKPKPSLHKGLTIVDPTATDDATLFFTPVAVTITDVRSHIVAGTNVVFNLQHASTRNGTGLDVFTSSITLTSLSGQSNSTGFNDATIPANSWVWLNVVSVSGAVTQFHATAIYTED